MRKRCAAAAKKNQKIKNENVPKSTPRCTENERHLCAPVAFGPGRPRTPPPWTPTISTASCNKKGNGQRGKTTCTVEKRRICMACAKIGRHLGGFFGPGGTKGESNGIWQRSLHIGRRRRRGRRSASDGNPISRHLGPAGAPPKTRRRRRQCATENLARKKNGAGEPAPHL